LPGGSTVYIDRQVLLYEDELQLHESLPAGLSFYYVTQVLPMTHNFLVEVE